VNLNDVDIRVVDQRIGMGVGGMDVIVRAWHKPTGLIAEAPAIGNRGQYYQREVALAMLEYGLAMAGWRTPPHADKEDAE
jgi:hypothetical protein